MCGGAETHSGVALFNVTAFLEFLILLKELQQDKEYSFKGY